MPVLGRLARNEALSADEVTRLTEWYGGESTLAADFDPDEPPDEDAKWPVAAVGGVRLSAVKPPSQDEFVALAKEVRALFGKRLHGDLRAAIDKQMAAATRPGYGSDLGAALLLKQAGAAAAYTISIEAARQPTDALTANNLGAALKDMREYPRALRCLTYARHLAPSLVCAVSSLGWLQAQMGDTATAEQTFDQALALDPADDYANEGKALLGIARGDTQAAYRQLIRLLKSAYLPGAAGAMTIIADTEFGGGEEASEPANLPADSPAFEPIEHPAGKGAGRPPTFSDPPPVESLTEAIAAQEAISQWVQAGLQESFRVTSQRNALAVPRDREDAAGISYRSAERERFVLTDLSAIYSRRCNRIVERAGFVALREEAQKRADVIREQMKADLAAAFKLPPAEAAPAVEAARAKSCAALSALGKQLWERLYGNWKTVRDQVRHELVDYHHFAQPWLEDLNDPAECRFRSLSREVDIRNIEQQVRTQLSLCLMACRILYCDEVQPAKREGKGQTDMDDAKSGKCRAPTLSWKLGALSLEADCDKVKFEVGEGAMLGAEMKLGKTRAGDELTVFVGAGAKGSGGPFDLKVAAGGYVTIKGDGTFVDVGMKETFKAEINLGPTKLGGTLEGRIGVNSGLSGSAKPAFKVAGKM